MSEPARKIVLSPEAQAAIDQLSGKAVEEARAIGKTEEPTGPAPVMLLCERPGCGRKFPRNQRGKPRRFCSDDCARAHRPNGAKAAPSEPEARSFCKDCGNRLPAGRTGLCDSCTPDFEDWRPKRQAPPPEGTAEVRKRAPAVRCACCKKRLKNLDASFCSKECEDAYAASAAAKDEEERVETDKCRECGTVFERKKSGQPRIYCGANCRAAASRRSRRLAARAVGAGSNPRIEIPVAPTGARHGYVVIVSGVEVRCGTAAEAIDLARMAGGGNS